MSFSRREFLQQTSSAALVGMITTIPAWQARNLRAADVLPPPDEPYLRAMALKAVDAAREAGAEFAEMRINAARYLYAGAGAHRMQGSPEEPPNMAEFMVGCPIRYGVRALVEGVWGFASETSWTPDDVVTTARLAVAVARANRTRHRKQLELAPRPVATGTWDTPMDRDPLSVPLHEMGELAVAAVTEAYKYDVNDIYISLHWRRPTTVYASTDGSLILQRLCHAGPSVTIYKYGMKGFGSGVIPTLRVGPYGYEAVIPDRLIPEAGEAAKRALIPPRDKEKDPSVEPGRYDIVLSAGAAAVLATGTLSSALVADYALGYLQNGDGISFASPPNKMLGKLQVASPLITIHADRTRPRGAGTIGWDEEGVKPDAYTIIDRGMIADYHTNRETAPQLREGYEGRGETPRSHGCMRRSGGKVPVICPPNMTMVPAEDSTRMEDLIRDVKKGFYITQLSGLADHQAISGQYATEWARTVTNGKLGGYVKDFALQMLTVPFWKNVDAIGGKPSVESVIIGSDGEGADDPSQGLPISTFDCVPVRARKVNVLNTGRTA